MAMLTSSLKVTLLDDVSKRAKTIMGSLRGIEQQSSKFISPLRSLTTQALAIGGAYLGVTSGFEGTFKAAADMQAGLTEIGIKSDLSKTQLGQLQQQLTALAPKVNQTTTDLLKGVDVMTTMGASAKEAADAIPAIGKTATATGAAIDDLSGASVSAMQNLNVMPAQIQQMLEGMTAAGNAGAFEMKDMARYFPQLTASARALGMRGVPAVNDMAAALQIARRGAGDASSAATNLSNFMSKIVNPQTTKNLKKFGVDVTKELEKANKNGISPIEHFIQLVDKVTKGGKSDLVTQIFGDQQVLDFVKPMLADYKDYLKIRTEADNANGVVAAAFDRRMGDANQKVKAFQIGMQNLGTSIGSHLLEPVGNAASYLANVLDTLGSRVTVFDQVKIAADGFMNGLGFKNGTLGEVAKEWRDFIFGIEDGGKAADQAGSIFKRFRDWGADIRSFLDVIKENPIGRFLADLAPYGFKIALWSVGIGWLASSVGKLAGVLWSLSGAASIVKAMNVAGTIADVLSGGTFPKMNGGSNKGTPSADLSPMQWLASAATWFKGLGIAAAPGMMAEALTYTPGDTFEEQVANQKKSRESIERLLGIKYDANGVSNWTRATNTGAPSSVSALMAMQNAIGARAAGIGGNSTDTLPGKQADDLGLRTIRIDAGSIAEMSRPSGVQDVREINRQPPNVTIHAPITINGVVDPQKAADAAISKLGAEVKAHIESSFSD